MLRIMKERTTVDKVEFLLDCGTCQGSVVAMRICKGHYNILPLMLHAIPGRTGLQPTGSHLTVEAD